MSRPGNTLGLLVLTLLLTACAARPTGSSTRVTLLPQADGKPSAVTVRLAGATVVSSESQLDLPYQTVLARANQPLAKRSEPADQVRRNYEPLFNSAPPPPARFVLYFRIGNTQLTTESQQALGSVLAETLSRSGAEIVLIGHTDTTSTGESNDVLSRRRAMLLRDQFIHRGFPPALIDVTGRGERDPAVKTRNDVEEPRNRRVEILVR